MNICIRNSQREYVIDKSIKEMLRNIVREAISLEEIKAPIEVSITFVNNKSIKKLNNEFRKIDKPTDVLSFPMYERNELKEVFKSKINQGILIGDIVISLEKAYEQSKEYGHSAEREIAYLLVHGLLHLLGYDHIEKSDNVLMRAREEKILKSINLQRVRGKEGAKF